MAKSVSTVQTDFGVGVVIERPTGYYWKLKGDVKEHGPFAVAIDAISDMEADEFDDDNEADYGVGAAAWTDPDTGMLPGAAELRFEDYN